MSFNLNAKTIFMASLFGLFGVLAGSAIKGIPFLSLDAVLFGAVAGGIFIVTRAVIAVALHRADASRQLKRRTRSQRQKREDLRQRLLEAGKIQLVERNDAELKPWMSPFIGGMQNADRLRSQLATAGYRGQNAITNYVLARIGVPLIGAAIGVTVASLLTSGAMVPGIAATVMALAGWSAIPFQLGQKSLERGEKVGAGMADTVDILLIYVTAGVPFDAAIEDAVPKLKRIAPPMADELERLNRDLLTTNDRQDAFDSFLARAQSTPVLEFVSIVKQADKEGTPMSAALARLSETLRKERFQTAERKAGKIPSMLLMPQLLFAFPAFVMTILFSPIYEAAQQMMKMFSS
ncbi:type II secretion system F family protein [Citreimonas salinaria]|uniref:Flp pilus assembly protein TadB n=1 Tax=Citreimonas salinaria TaxID=321339 RepID=A0A1H3M181_9RHOB|nr:type II secretion system F family protein [Citreimonas salinaria]SDY69999.1 Flp pilus assembly protein TadB [Citreimonas salinaria]